MVLMHYCVSTPRMNAPEHSSVGEGEGRERHSGPPSGTSAATVVETTRCCRSKVAPSSTGREMALTACGRAKVLKLSAGQHVRRRVRHCVQPKAGKRGAAAQGEAGHWSGRPAQHSGPATDERRHPGPLETPAGPALAWVCQTTSGRQGAQPSLTEALGAISSPESGSPPAVPRTPQRQQGEPQGHSCQLGSWAKGRGGRGMRRLYSLGDFCPRSPSREPPRGSPEDPR